MTTPPSPTARQDPLYVRRDGNRGHASERITLSATTPPCWLDAVGAGGVALGCTIAYEWPSPERLLCMCHLDVRSRNLSISVEATWASLFRRASRVVRVCLEATRLPNHVGSANKTANGRSMECMRKSWIWRQGSEERRVERREEKLAISRSGRQVFIRRQEAAAAGRNYE